MRTAPKSLTSIPALATLALLATGIALRIWYYWDARSLFIDEANLALNISELPYRNFFRPLLYDQYAPPLFLALSKAAVQLLGNHEWALRLWPLGGAIFTLFALRALSEKLSLAGAVRWFPMAMLALSPFMLRFSTEVKQYSTDAALALGLLLLALQLPPGKMRPWHYGLWAIIGGLSVWLSMPAAFVLTGIGAWYLYGLVRQNQREALLPLALMSLTWILSFGALYLLVLQAGTEREVLLDYHAAYFFPLQLWEGSAWRQLGSIFYGLLSPVLGFTVVGLITGTGLLFWGSYRLFRQHTGLFLLIVTPVLAGIAASAVQLFSLIPRVALFMMPFLLLLAAYGASEAWKNGSRYLRVVLLALLILEAAPFVNSLARLGHSTEIEDLRGVLLDIRKADEVGPAYIYAAATPAYRYYSQWHYRQEEYKLPNAILLRWDSPLKELFEQGRTDAPGFWLVFSQLLSDEARAATERKIGIAKEIADEKRHFEKAGAAGYWLKYR